MGNNFLIFITIIFLVLYFPRLIGWFWWIFPQKSLKCGRKHCFALIVPARDEGRAVLPLFKSIQEQSYGADYSLFDTYVVVKNPRDEVIDYAREIGAKVYVDEEQKSKGDCLDYCIRHILAAGKKYDGYIIVDADCRLDERCACKRSAGDNGAEAGRKLYHGLFKQHFRKGGKCHNLSEWSGMADYR